MARLPVMNIDSSRPNGAGQDSSGLSLSLFPSPSLNLSLSPSRTEQSCTTSDIDHDNFDILYIIDDNTPSAPLAGLLWSCLVGILAGSVVFGIVAWYPRVADTVVAKGVVEPLLLVNCLVSDLVPFAFLRRGIRAVQVVLLLPTIVLHSTLASPLFWGCIAYLVSGAFAAPADWCHRCMETGHLAANCPLVTGVAGNVVAVAAATYTTMKLAKLMPPWLARLFPSTALQMLVTLATRSTKGTETFDFAGKHHGEIIEAVRAGVITASEAVSHISKELVGDPSDAGVEAKHKAAYRAMNAINGMPAVAKNECGACSSDVVCHGVFRYVLSRCQIHVMNGGDAAMYTSKVIEDVKGATSYDAKYRHPKKPNEFFEMLWLWSWAVHATGVADFLVVTRFVQKVVYEPQRRNNWSWMMAYCHLLAYFEAIEDSADEEHQLNLSNVVAFGGTDTRRDRAMVLGGGIFGSLFASESTSARDSRNFSATTSKTSDGVKGSTTSKLPCKVYNSGGRHSDAVVAKGTCDFKHGCSQVTGKDDKGNDTYCFADHPIFRHASAGKQ